MTIARVKPAGWGVGDKLASSEANGIDLNTVAALDKRAGQTDTLNSVVTATGAGRLNPSVYPMPDADVGGLVPSTGVNVVRVSSAVTANRVLVLPTSNFATNDVITVFCDPTFNFAITVQDQASVTICVLGNTNVCDAGAAAFIYLGGWRLLSLYGANRSHMALLTASGQSVPIPLSATAALLVGCGGGGAGGAGFQIASATDRSCGGGAGGGGAILTTLMIPVVPGGTLTATTIGAGGTCPNVVGANGSDGGQSIVTDGTNTASFNGGGGGSGGYYLATGVGAGTLVYVPGGMPMQNWPRTNSYINSATGGLPPTLTVLPQQGGYGTISNTVPTAGGGSPQGYTGGLAGSSGTGSGSYFGGGPGGGGGGGPGGSGGAGGTGGNANSAGSGTVGTAGASAAANSGAGGGGGGGTGQGSSGSPATPVPGGAGGSGFVRVFWIK